MRYIYSKKFWYIRKKTRSSTITHNHQKVEKNKRSSTDDWVNKMQ